MLLILQMSDKTCLNGGENEFPQIEHVTEYQDNTGCSCPLGLSHLMSVKFSMEDKNVYFHCIR